MLCRWTRVASPCRRIRLLCLSVCLRCTTTFATDATQAEVKMDCWQPLADVSNVLNSSSCWLCLSSNGSIPTRQHSMISQSFQSDKIATGLHGGPCAPELACVNGRVFQWPSSSSEQWCQAAFSQRVEPTECFGGYTQRSRSSQRPTQGSCIWAWS